MCSIDDAEPCEFLHEVRRRAKKTHRCGECAREISAGEVYEVAVGRWDDFNVHKTCAQCISARDWLMQECNGWMYGGVAEDLIEHMDGDDGSPEHQWLAQAVAGIRAKWRTLDGALMAPLPEYRMAA